LVCGNVLVTINKVILCQAQLVRMATICGRVNHPGI